MTTGKSRPGHGKPRSISDNLRQLLDLFTSKDNVLITIDADPDSMASAMALKRILWRRVRTVTIAHFNEIRRFDNLTMARLLKIPLVKLNKIDSQNFSKILLVDGQPDHHESFTKFKYDAVIDHHPVVVPVMAPFTDIRPEYGATATIMTEYLRAVKIRPSKSLATALVYAIRADTRNFEADALDEDVKAFHFLFQYANMHLLSRIETAEMGLEELKYFQRALKNRLLREGRIFSYLGRVHSQDTLVLVADFFMKCQEVTWSVVFGIYRKNLVVVIRNDGLRKNAGSLASKAFGFFGNAGGHRAMARAEIPLVNLEVHLTKYGTATLSQFVIRQLEKSIR
ncbi:MAG: DHH family phosphoesterase [Desulfobacterales bacterium]|jgi:nanoRNase/pAp phosphatase (c-di-AMP/oligoRNAs hydrolase)